MPTPRTVTETLNNNPDMIMASIVKLRYCRMYIGTNKSPSAVQILNPITDTISR